MNKSAVLNAISKRYHLWAWDERLQKAVKFLPTGVSKDKVVAYGDYKIEIAKLAFTEVACNRLYNPKYEDE